MNEFVIQLKKVRQIRVPENTPVFCNDSIYYVANLEARLGCYECCFYNKDCPGECYLPSDQVLKPQKNE